MSTSIPIVQSNAIVESFWSVLKKDHLRPQGARPKPEILVDVLMNDHLARLAHKIEAQRKLTETVKPAW